MRPRSDDRTFGAAAPFTVRNAIKDRLIIAGLTLAALLFLLGFVPTAHTTLEASLNLHPWAHMTLEASLNLLWILLAVCALAHWAAPSARRCSAHVRGLVTLVFVLSLLFPVISANDDLVQLDLLNDAKTSQLIISTLKNDKHLPVLLGLTGSLGLTAIPSTPFVPTNSWFLPEPAQVATVATPGDTTGNHSPPLC